MSAAGGYQSGGSPPSDSDDKHRSESAKSTSSSNRPFGKAADLAAAQMPAAPPARGAHATYRPVPERFTMLAIFCAGSFGSALGWLSLAPITDLAEERFGVGPGGVNLISNTFLMLYIPGSLLSLYCVEAYGLSRNINLGIFLSFLMTVVKSIGVSLQQPKTAYLVTLLGQAIGGLGEPLILNVAARLSMDWFPESERDVATTAATMSNILGMMVASFAAPLIASRQGFAAVQYYQCGFFLLVALASYFLLPGKPPFPPSPAAAIQWSQRAKGSSIGLEALSATWHDVSDLLRNRNFLLLMSGFAIAMGAVWALLMVDSQLVVPCGYTDEFAGFCGACLLGTGVVAAFVLSYVMETTKEYVLLQKANLVLFAVAVATLYLSNRPDNRTVVVAAWSFLGLALEPLMPLTLEHAAEMTFPICADSSTALLLMFANSIGGLLTFVLTPLLQLPVSETCSSVFTPAAFFVMALVLVGVGLTMFVEKDYRRHAAEHDPEMMLAVIGRDGLGGEMGEAGAGKGGGGGFGEAAGLGAGSGGPLGRGFGLSRSPSAGRLSRRWTGGAPLSGEEGEERRVGDPMAEPLLGGGGKGGAGGGGQGWGGLAAAPPVMATWAAGGGGQPLQQQELASSRKEI